MGLENMAANLECSHCHGTGVVSRYDSDLEDEDNWECEYCKGTGKIECVSHDGQDPNPEHP